MSAEEYKPSVADRTKLLAMVFGHTPMESCALSPPLNNDGAPKGWWIVGCFGGDVYLPGTNGKRTERSALAAAEAWVSKNIGEAK